MMSVDRWSCPSCTFSNVSATLACQMCSRSRIQLPNTPSPSAASHATNTNLTALRSERAEGNYGITPVTNNSEDHRNRWTCSVCSLSNLDTHTRCTVCDSPRPPVIGGAIIVDLPMPVSSIRRAAPTQAQPTASSSSSSSHTIQRTSTSPGQFQCKTCTYMNPAQSSSCEMCGAANATGVADSSSPVSTWTCTVCSLLNTIDSVRCTVCRGLSPLAPRSNAHPAQVAPPPVRVARGQVVPMLARQASEHRSSANPQFGGAMDVIQPSVPTGSGSGYDAMLDPSGERDAAIQWQEIMSVCGSTRNAFTDDSFRPGDRALYGSTQHHPVGWLQKNRGPFSWKRGRSTTKSSSASWCILPFRSEDGTIDVKPSDIKQGELGDCWFVSALSVLAERPRLIEHLILTPYLNDVGAYQIRFCKNGAWRTITVDDYLPVNPNTGRLAFSHTPGNELWVPLIEKAYAKLHGSYAAIESGAVCDAFEELTGAPSERIELHLEEMSKYNASKVRRQFGIGAAAAGSGGDGGSIDSPDSYDPVQHRDMLWATILSFRASRFLMGASCGRKEADPEVYQSVGLRADHAYAVLDARSEGGVQLIQLRNPWGSGGWTGDWSQNSPLWTPQLRKLLNYPSTAASASSSTSKAILNFFTNRSSSSGDDVNGGLFWMCFKDFLHYFRTIDVCKYQDDWHVIRLKDEFPLSSTMMSHQLATPIQFGQPIPTPITSASSSFLQSSHQQSTPWSSGYMYELTVPASSWCFISIIQQDLRGTNATKPYKFESIGLFILKSKSSNPIETHLADYQRCVEIFPQTQRTVTCETLMTDVQGRYLVLPCSYAATIAANTSMALPSAANGGAYAKSDPSFPFILSVYSQQPILIKRRPAFLPAITIAMQIATIRGQTKALSEYATLYTFTCQGGLWFVVVNRHPSKYLSITVDCSTSIGLIPSRGTLHGPNAFRTRDFVPPRHRQLLLALLTPQSSTGYSYHRSCTYTLVDGVSGDRHTPLLRRGYDIHQPIVLDHGFVAQIV